MAAVEAAPKIRQRAVGADDAWRASPAGFARKIHDQVWPAHLRLVSQIMVLVATGRINRLTVSMPPGHAKSTAVMRVFPAWLLDLWPDRRIIGASYGAALAVDHGKAVRETIDHHADVLRVRLKGDSSAADTWQTTANGGMVTAGIGGAITGRRAHMGLCDDLHKSYDDAHSLNGRTGVWDFWTGTMRPRLFPGASAVVIGTRWHEEDIIGRLHGGDERSQWAALRLPAIAEEDETIESVLGVDVAERLRREGVELPTWSRAEGEALWPHTIDPESGTAMPWYDLDELRSVRMDIGEYKWAALYQQRPAPPQGEMFPASEWDRADVVPPKTPMIRFWDLAATGGGGDETAGALVCRDEDGYVYIVDIVHGRWDDTNVEKVLKRTAEADAEKYGRRVKTIIEQEGGSGGKAWSRRLVREVLAGHNVAAEPPSGQKDVRARPLAAQQQAGFVRLVRRLGPDGVLVPPPWVDPFVEQARVFPNGKHDDMVDAVSAAFNALIGVGSRRVRTSSAARTTLPG